MKAAETDLAPSERLFVQVGLRVRIRLPPGESRVRTCMLAELDQTGESQISLTDPDSRAMAAHTHVAVGYDVQIAVDAKHKLIVEQQVTSQVVDMGLLAQTAEPAKEALGVERIAVVADRGYFKIEDIEACEKAGI